MKVRTVLSTIGLLALAVFGTATAAQAAPTANAAISKCANIVAAKYLASTSPVTTRVDPAADAREAALKAQYDTNNETPVPRSAADDALKQAKAAVGNAYARDCLAAAGLRLPATFGSGYGYLEWMYHYGQDTSSWCGEATVEEMSSTVPGPSRIAIPQSEIASWLGNGRSDGTSVDQEAAALNHYVGQPDFGFTFYHMVWMNGSPTSAQRAAFLSDLQLDVGTYYSPVAGDAYEVVGGHHLAGHPNKNIFHWFAIGGWNTNTSQIWYTDSATTVWSSVPAYSWFSMYDAETIMGGRGYIW